MRDSELRRAPWADQGYADARNSMGSLHQAGEGVTQDYALARPWYERAANQRHALATNNLAYLYDVGLGVPEDNPRAAELGEPRAMLNLGIMRHDGEPGVDRDLVESYKCLDLARFYTQFSKDMQVK